MVHSPHATAPVNGSYTPPSIWVAGTWRVRARQRGGQGLRGQGREQGRSQNFEQRQVREPGNRRPRPSPFQSPARPQRAGHKYSFPSSLSLYTRRCRLQRGPLLSAFVQHEWREGALTRHESVTRVQAETACCLKELGAWRRHQIRLCRHRAQEPPTPNLLHLLTIETKAAKKSASKSENKSGSHRHLHRSHRPRLLPKQAWRQTARGRRQTWPRAARAAAPETGPPFAAWKSRAARPARTFGRRLRWWAATWGAPPSLLLPMARR